eukprot:TRINITY_DN18292_c0_g1_i1.p1 TRINITY_DN18292_c0_g1~~TRINITY_DN18292_c0_g1_i1.p1  ORF type:complete len:338 (-),score=83.09 TRINITY_DN18292_c0_g1_i1:299-1312(-)
MNEERYVEEKEVDMKGGDNKVTFQMISDIHLEFGQVDLLPEIPVCSRVLCLLGDIGYPNSESYQEFLKQQADRFEHVIVIAGNHEYYKQKSHSLTDELIQQTCNSRPNLHFLNKSTFELDGVLFLGCTLWPSIPKEHIELIELMCNDYKQIYLDPPPETKSQTSSSRKKLTAQITNQWHIDNSQWLKSQIISNSLSSSPKPLVILTHHSPSEHKCLWPRNADSFAAVWKYMQYGNLEKEIMELKEAKDYLLVWGFGHTHHSSDYIRGNGVRVVSNQCGYLTANCKASDTGGSNRFEPEKVIDLEQTRDRIEEWRKTGVDPHEVKLNEDNSNSHYKFK